MSGIANVARGEAAFVVGDRAMVVRPSFAALVAAEEEVGPLLALIDRAAEGRLTLAEMEGLLWHCLVDRPADMRRSDLGEALVTGGVSAALPALRTVLRQALSGGQ